MNIIFLDYDIKGLYMKELNILVMILILKLLHAAKMVVKV